MGGDVPGFDVPTEWRFDDTAYPTAPKRLVNSFGASGKKKSNKHVSEQRVEELLAQTVRLPSAAAKAKREQSQQETGASDGIGHADKAASAKRNGEAGALNTQKQKHTESTSAAAKQQEAPALLTKSTEQRGKKRKVDTQRDHFEAGAAAKQPGAIASGSVQDNSAPKPGTEKPGKKQKQEATLQAAAGKQAQGAKPAKEEKAHKKEQQAAGSGRQSKPESHSTGSKGQGVGGAHDAKRSGDGELQGKDNKKSKHAEQQPVKKAASTEEPSAAAAKPSRQSQQSKKQAEAKGVPAPAAGKGAAVAGPGGKGGGSSLLDKMRAKLQGGRFRYLNEQLYTCKGDDAFGMMQTDPSLFKQYHDGFQQQTKSWPKQPLDVAVGWLKSRPKEFAVADFGCGDARLAKSVAQKVHSFDLVACAPGVVTCNMAAVPLPDASIDVAVFSLALMGTDYGAYLKEATRVLKYRGWLWIAEVRSRFAVGDDDDDDDDEAGGKGGKGGSGDEDFGPFLRCLAKLGYTLVNQDASNRMFVVWVLRKTNTPPAIKDMPWPKLKACVYKRR